jgi:hypothetical protein
MLEVLNAAPFTEMDHWKIGFHTGPGGNRRGIGDYWKALDAAGIPAINITVDDAGPAFELDQIAQVSGVEHINVYRVHIKISGFNADVPIYGIDPDEAAEIWWETMYMHLPPELMDGLTNGRIWLIAGNEVDKNRASWLGYWALGVAKRANAVGISIAAFGWSSGEPEYDHWLEPGMVEYLKYCAEYPNKAGLAIHEYSYTMDLNDGIGYLIGRFTYILDVCNSLGIQAPKILITEFGWTYTDVPEPTKAIDQMIPIAELYEAYPEILGAMIWYLGIGFSDIANQAQRLIAPVTEIALEWGYYVPPEGDKMDLANFFIPKVGYEHGPIYMIYNNWGQGPERSHLARSPNGSQYHFYVSKNDRWERRYISTNWIWLQTDTSRADNEFYTVSGDPWMPRYMSVGQVHIRDEFTRIYTLDNCQQIATGSMISGIEFLGQHTEKAASLAAAWGCKVIELHWLVGGNVEERYFYGEHVGLVAWENRAGKASEIREFVPSSEQPNRIDWHCSVLNEGVPATDPPPVEPPPPNDLYQRAWDTTVDMQVSGIGGLRLNKDAGIQKRVTQDNAAGLSLQIVTDEVIIDGVTFAAAESLTGVVPRRVYFWQPGFTIGYFEDPG